MSDTDQPYALKTLLRVDALTLQWSPFYSEETIGATPISWSSQGNYLAVRRDTMENGLELCLIDRFGALQRCFEDPLSYYAYRPHRDEITTITWSENGQKIYFLAERERVLSVVEGDTLTGETTRTIYQSPDRYYEWVPLIHWTPDLEYVAVYESELPFTSDFARTVTLREGVLINLNTGEHLQISTTDPQLGSLYFCEGFSPQGTYLTARAYSEAEETLASLARPPFSGFALIDHTGQITPAVDAGLLAQHQIDWAMCPTWAHNEEAFYFLGGTWPTEEIDQRSIFKFNLSTHELIEVYQFEPHEGPAEAPLLLSPDESAIAFTFAYPNLMLSEIVVLLATGEIVQFDTPSTWNIRPLWVPLSEPR